MSNRKKLQASLAGGLIVIGVGSFTGVGAQELKYPASSQELVKPGDSTAGMGEVYRSGMVNEWVPETRTFERNLENNSALGTTTLQNSTFVNSSLAGADSNNLGWWNKFKNWWQKPITNSAVLSVNSWLKTWNARFGLERLYGQQVGEIVRGIKTKDYGLIGAGVLGVIAKTAGVIAVGMASGLVLGKSYMAFGDLNGGVSKIWTSVKSVAVRSWGWLNAKISIAAVAVRKWVVAAAKKVDFITKNITRVTNRISNSVQKILTASKNLRVEISGWSKMFKSWSKILVSGWLIIANALSIGGTSVSNNILDVGKTPNTITTARVETSSITKQPATGVAGKNSTTAQGGNNKSATNTKSTEVSTKNTSSLSANTQQSATSKKTSELESSKVLGANISSVDAVVSKLTPMPTTEKAVKMNVVTASTGLKSQDATVKTSNVKADTQMTSVKPTPSLAKTTVAQASEAGLSKDLKAGIKSVTSAMGKLGTQIKQFSTNTIPRYLSAGYLPDSAEKGIKPTGYQAATLTAWAMLSAMATIFAGMWLYQRIKKRQTEPESVLIS